MTQTSTLDIHLLLARHDDQRPVFGRALNGLSSAREPRPSLPHRHPSAATLWQRDQLEQQGWGVIAPPGERGDHLLELMRPLIEHRRAEQGTKVRILRSPPSPGDVSLLEALQWRDAWNQKQPARALPYYLLILGGFEDIPLAVQRALSVTGNHAVGRLYFDHDRQYRAYADKLCTRERAARREGYGDIVLHAVRDGSRAVDDGDGNHFQPLLQGARAAHMGAADQVRESGSSTPQPDELFQAAASTRPSVLFSTSLGEGAPHAGWSSSKEQRAYQGAMSFGNGQRVTGDDVSQRVFLPGGVWLMHGSFSAGTPLWSSYLGWLQKLADSGDAAAGAVLACRPIDDVPFIASLARAALANKSGPLAVIGHVDLAFAPAFAEPMSADGSRSAALVRFMVSLAHGHRVGSSMSALFEYLGHVDAYLVALYSKTRAEQDEPGQERERGLFWLLREELAGYVMLGDPATRLAVQPPIDDIASPALGYAAADNPDAGPRVRLERAIADHILGQPASVALARQRLSNDISEERFTELARAYREAGGRVLDQADVRDPEPR